MPNLSLQLDETRLFGEFFPSVFIDRVVIAYPTPESASLVQDTTKNLQFQTTLSLNITKPADAGINLVDWVKNYLSELSLFAFLSPFKDLNTQLEQSQLSLKEMFAAVTKIGSVDPQDFDSSSKGFSTVIAYIIESFVNDYHAGDGYALTAYTQREGALGETWNDTWREAHLYNGDEGYPGEALWGLNEDGTLNVDGPWPTDDPDSYCAEILPFVMQFFGGMGTYATGAKMYQKPLTMIVTDFEDDDRPASAGVISQVSYDNKGNEIIEISDIPLIFEYATEDIEGDDSDEAKESILASIEKLFLVATIGPTEMITTLADQPAHLFNSSFGNITYEYIMSSGSPPPQEETIFVKIDTGDMINETPIQARNAKYYNPTPTSQQTVIEGLENLISNFTVSQQQDNQLAMNIANLEQVMATNATSMSLVPKLFTYAASYVGKDPGSRSGAFFQAFSQILVAFEDAIVQQEQLSKNLVLNDRVLDRRPSATGSRSYWPPTPLGADILSPSGWLIPDYGEDYISNKWAMMTRYAEETIPTFGLLSDFAEFAIGEGFAAGSRDLATIGESIYGEEVRSAVFGAESFMVDNTDPSADKDMLFTDSVVANKGFWFFDWEKALYLRSNLAQVISLRRLQDLFHLSVPYRYFGASQVKMHRREYELQLQNDTDADPNTYRLDEYVDIEMTLHMSAPNSNQWPQSDYVEYKYDPEKMKYGQPFVYTADFMKEAEDDGPILMMASLLNLESLGDSGAEVLAGMGYTEETGWVGSRYEDAVGAVLKEETSWGGTIALEDMAESLASMMIFADATDLEHRSPSYLKTQIIDVGARSNNLLLNFNPYPSYIADDVPDTDTTDPLTYTAESGRGPADGYRLLCFNYRDYMDDDVAYYNTYGSIEGARNGVAAGALSNFIFAGIRDAAALMGSATSDGNVAEFLEEFAEDPLQFDVTQQLDVWTKYEVGVAVSDKTIYWFTSVVLPSFRFTLERMRKYYQQASQMCNENNITGRFTDYFSENIEKYYDDRGETYPWAEAAWMYNALRDLFFNAFSGAHANRADIPAIMEAARRDADQISPSKATLQIIEEYMINFDRLLTIVDPAIGGEVAYYPVYERMGEVLGIFDAEALSPVTTDGDTYNDVMNSSAAVHSFSNTIPITSMIYGNLSLAAFWDNQFPDAPSTMCFEDDESGPGGLPTMETPAGWMTCVWPTYSAMRLGIGIGDAVAIEYKISESTAISAAAAAYAGTMAAPDSAYESDELREASAMASGAMAYMSFASYWQESVLVQAFINEFREQLDEISTPPWPPPPVADSWTSFRPIGSPGEYSDGAWFWPPPTMGENEYYFGPDPSNFVSILQEMGIINPLHIRALALGWQTLFVGSKGDWTDTEGYSTGTSTWEMIGPHFVPHPLPPKFGFIPMSIDNPNPTWTWPRTLSPERLIGYMHSMEFGDHINKLIYVPDTRWDPTDWNDFGVEVYATSTSSDGTSSGGGEHSLIPQIYGLGLNSNFADGPVVDVGGVGGHSTNNAIKFQTGVGFVDAGMARDNVVCWTSRLPYTTAEISQMIEDFFDTGFFGPLSMVDDADPTELG